MMDKNKTWQYLETTDELELDLIDFAELAKDAETRDELTVAKAWLQFMDSSFLIIEETVEYVPQYIYEYDAEVNMYYDGEYRCTTWKAEWELTEIIRSSAPWDYSRTGNTKCKKISNGVKRVVTTHTRPMTDAEIVDAYRKDWIDLTTLNFD